MYTFGWLAVLYVYLIVVSNLVPTGPYRNVWSMGGIFLIVLGVVIQDFYFMYVTNPHPYIRATIYPSGRTIRMFIAENGIQSRKLSDSMWATTLKLRFPIIMRPPITAKQYGKVSELAIMHEWPFSKRVVFTPGRCAYLGYVVKHPQTEQLVLYEYPRGSYEVDHAKALPILRLKHASQDYFLPPISLSTALKSNPTAKNFNIITSQSKRIERLTMENTALRRGLVDKHEKYIAVDEQLSEKDTELKGLLEGGRNFTKAVVQRMLSYHQDHLTIENAIKHLRGLTEPAFTFNKWLAVTFMVLGSFVFLWSIRGFLGETGAWLSSPINIGAILAVAVAACLLLYYFLIRKRK